MEDQLILNELIADYNTSDKKIISDKLPFPKAFKGDKKTKTIVLGADPTHITKDGITDIKVVFNLCKSVKYRYWNSIERNINQLGLELNDLYVQNICRNFFEQETSKHKQLWIAVAQNFWIEKLKKELDSLFEKDIPILMTTQFILQAALKSKSDFLPAQKVYNECLFFSRENNFLDRNLYALYRHPLYSLENYHKYADFLRETIN